MVVGSEYDRFSNASQVKVEMKYTKNTHTHNLCQIVNAWTTETLDRVTFKE